MATRLQDRVAGERVRGISDETSDGGVRGSVLSAAPLSAARLDAARLDAARLDAAPDGVRQAGETTAPGGPGVERSDRGEARGVAAWPARLRARLTAEPEAGMSTAEYAVGTVAACAFAAVLYSVVTGGSVVTALGGLVADALATLG